MVCVDGVWWVNVDGMCGWCVVGECGWYVWMVSVDGVHVEVRVGVGGGMGHEKHCPRVT